MVNIRVENAMKDKAIEVPAIATIIERWKQKWLEMARFGPCFWNRAAALRVMAEAPTDAEVDYYVDTIADVVRAEIGLIEEE